MKLTAYIVVMAIVTYVIRALPITIFHKEIKSKWLKAFLYYIPYAVLGAMTFSTGSVVSASLGLAAAFIAAFFDAGLTVTAVAAVFISFIFGFFI